MTTVTALLTNRAYRVLRKYLDAWIPIMATQASRLALIDGFAGPGSHSGGEPGSPMIMIDASARMLAGTASKRARRSSTSSSRATDLGACAHRIGRTRPFRPIQRRRNVYLLTSISAAGRAPLEVLLERREEVRSMKRRLGALIAAALLTGVLAGPATAAKPALNVSVAKASASCSITVNVSWNRPQRGQGLLTIYLEDNRTSFRPYVQFAVSPTATSGSATFVIGSNTDGYSDSLTGWAYLNRDFDSTRFSYDLLLTGSSTALVTPDCILTHS